jgi:formate/nitrite transporter
MPYVTPYQLIDDVIHSGVLKSSLTIKQMFLRGTLSGAILGAATAVSLTAAAQTGLPIVGAVLFPAGFAIILLLGLELVTGSFALIPLAILEGRTTPRQGLTNFGVVTGAHLFGAVLFGLLYVVSITYLGSQASDPVIQAIIKLADHKVLPYEAVGPGGILVAIIKGMLANWMVALGTMMFYVSKSTAGKVLAMWLPVTIFFSLGFEHAIVNMFVIPAGMMLGAPISIGQWLLWNQIPVLVGNLLGAILFTALPVYFSHRIRVNRAAAHDGANDAVLSRS